MRHPWRITVPAQATRHPPAKGPVRAVGRAGFRWLWRVVPQSACSGSRSRGKGTPCVDALAFRTASAAHGSALPCFNAPAPAPAPAPARAGRSGQVGSGRVGPSEVKPSQAKAIQGNSRQFKAGQGKASQRRHALALRLHTSHVSTGWRGWGGGTVMRHGWRISSPHGWVHGGSRDPTHAVPPRTNLKCRFCLGSSSS